MKMFYHKVLTFTLSCSVFSLCASESLYKEVLSATPIRESIPAHDIVLSKKLTNLIAASAVLQRIQGNQYVNSVSFNKDNSLIFIGSGNTIRTLFADDGALITEIQNGSGVETVSLSPDESHILVGSCDSKARLWNAFDGTLKLEFPHEKGHVFATFSPDGERVLTGSHDGTVKMWNANTGKLIWLYRDTKTVPQIVYSLYGNQTVVDAVPGFLSIAYSPDSTCVLAGTADGRALELHPNTGKLVREITHDDFRQVWVVGFSPDSKQLLSGGGDGIVKLWDRETGEEGINLVHRNRVTGRADVTSACYSPDGSYILTGSVNKKATLWNAKTGAEIQAFSIDAVLYDVAFSYDGTKILGGSSGTTATLWDLFMAQANIDQAELLKAFSVASFNEDSDSVGRIHANHAQGRTFNSFPTYLKNRLQRRIKAPDKRYQKGFLIDQLED